MMNRIDVPESIQLENEYKLYAQWDYKSLNQDPKACMEAVKDSSFALQYVKNPTPEMCSKAVRKNGLSLQFVPETMKTPALCMEAVKNDGFAIKYVSKQTPELVKEAIANAPCSLKYVKEQNLEICKEAVNNYSLAIKYAEYQDEELCIKALSSCDVHMYTRNEMDRMERKTCGLVYSNNGQLIQYVKNQTEELAKLAVSHCGSALNHVKPEFHTTEVCLVAVKNYMPSMKCVRNYSLEFCKAAFAYDPDTFTYVSQYEQTLEMVTEAVKAQGNCLQFVREDLKTPEVCRIALEHRPDMLPFVPVTLQVQTYSELSENARTQIPKVYYESCTFYKIASELEEKMLHDSNPNVRAAMAKLGYIDELKNDQSSTVREAVKEYYKNHPERAPKEHKKEKGIEL